MKNIIYRCVSIVLCLVLLIMPVRAFEMVEDDEVEKKPIMNDDLVPNFLNVSFEEKSKFLSRLREYENTDDTIGFLNKDGSNTIYIFPYNIRYRNENGDMVLYDQTIISTENDTYSTSRLFPVSNYEYRNKSSDVKVYFNDFASDDGCVIVEKDNVCISVGIVDKSKILSKGVVCDNNASQHAMMYHNAFGDGVYFIYSPTDFGVKEDVIISKYNGDNTLEFLINTYGLFPEIDQAGAILLTNKNKEVVGTIAPIFAYDSSESPKYNYDHDVELSCVNDSKYLLKYTINEEFLSDENTVFPVTIDPTIDLVSSNDAPVYSKHASVNYKTNATSCVGYESNWGTGRAYFSVNLSSLSNIKPEEISFAQLALRETTGSTTNATVQVHQVTSSWSASTITYNNQPSFKSSSLASFNANSEYDYWYYVDMTEIIKSWKKDNNNYGVLLKAPTDTTAYWRAFAKSNYSQIDLRPYWVVYTYARDAYNWGSFSTTGAKGEVVIGSNVYITFSVAAAGVYYIETAQPNAPYGVKRDTKLYLYNSAGNLLASNDDINGANNRYSRIEYSFSPGTYTIWFVEYGGSYNKIDSVAAYVSIWARNSLAGVKTATAECYSQNYANLCMDFIKKGDAGGYNCLGYAINKDNPKFVNPWGSGVAPTQAQSRSYLESLGYSVSSSSSPNCIVDYVDPSTGRVTHYARIDSGVVTAKCGSYEKMQHSSYDPYFEQSYGYYNKFYVK